MFRCASLPCKICFWQTGILTSAFLPRVEPLTTGSNPATRNTKIKHPFRVFDFCGGVEGIRTLDTVAGILHFQCSALDQLCDDSGFNIILRRNQAYHRILVRPQLRNHPIKSFPIPHQFRAILDRWIRFLMIFRRYLRLVFPCKIG